MEFLQVLESIASCEEFMGLEQTSTLISLLKSIITIIKVVVPILLVVWGMLDLGKAVIAQKEDDIKKGQNTLMKRSIAAVIVFLVPTIIGLLLKAIGENDIAECIGDIIG